MSLISKAFALYKIFSRDSFGEGPPFLVTRRRHGSHFLRTSFAGRRISVQSQTEEHAPSRKKSFHVGHNELANYSLTRAFFCFYPKSCGSRFDRRPERIHSPSHRNWQVSPG